MDSAENSKVIKRHTGRDRVEAGIVAAAVRIFAECGYEGTAVATIADAAGLSKQNLMYYFPTKQALYERVLDDVLDDWLARMESLANAEGEPADVLRAYIRAKMRFSREQPAASRVYAMEVIGGAKIYGEQMKRRVVPLLRRDIEIFETWKSQGRIAAAIDATHLLFALWALTQQYADFSAQMNLVLGRAELGDDDFERAEQLITHMITRTIAVD